MVRSKNMRHVSPWPSPAVMTTRANRSENQVISSHITNHRDKSLEIIDAGEFRRGMSWLEMVRRKKMHFVSMIARPSMTKFSGDDDKRQ
jgi:hypothetical protein